MKPSLFICWSGHSSNQVALAIKKWLPNIFDHLDVFMSQDTTKGVAWHEVISNRLENANVGIVCITPDSREAPWLLFESGALAKKTSERRLCTFLWHVDVEDVAKPLVPFQHTTAQNKQDVKQMVETINQTLGVFSIDQQRLDRRFQTAWKGFQHDLDRLSTTKPPAREDKLLQGINEIRVMLRTITQQPGVIMTDYDAVVDAAHPAELRNPAAELRRGDIRPDASAPKGSGKGPKGQRVARAAKAGNNR